MAIPNTVHKSTAQVAGDKIDVYHVDGGRYVVHFLAVPFRGQLPGESVAEHIDSHIEHAKAVLNGKKYRAKWFGGGIVFSIPLSLTITEYLELALTK